MIICQMHLLNEKQLPLLYSFSAKSCMHKGLYVHVI